MRLPIKRLGQRQRPGSDSHACGAAVLVGIGAPVAWGKGPRVGAI
jgi:hypothetical protein